MNKRFCKEVYSLIKEQQSKTDNDYIIDLDEENTNTVRVIIRAPFDSVYRHKFIRLDITIPENYPHSPPKVTFINYDGVRIHPNMYEDGRCCASILNTWGDCKYEKWTSSMGIETIIQTFYSFLDNNPYTHEPGGRDDETYTVYVLHQSWYTCLLKYLQNETIDSFREFMFSYMLKHIDDIFDDLEFLNSAYTPSVYFTSCFETGYYRVDYKRIRDYLLYYYDSFDVDIVDNSYGDEIEHSHDSQHEDAFNCDICYNTMSNSKQAKLDCVHTFHKECILTHIKSNGQLCPMCRKDISDSKFKELSEANWIINPQTKRKVKIGSRTYKYLKDNGII